MKAVLIFVVMMVMSACSCSTIPEPQSVLKTAKKNPEQRVCRLVREPLEVKGVYCVTYKGPADIKEKG